MERVAAVDARNALRLHQYLDKTLRPAGPDRLRNVLQTLDTPPVYQPAETLLFTENTEVSLRRWLDDTVRNRSDGKSMPSVRAFAAQVLCQLEELRQLHEPFGFFRHNRLTLDAVVVSPPGAADARLVYAGAVGADKRRDAVIPLAATRNRRALIRDLGAAVVRDGAGTTLSARPWRVASAVSVYGDDAFSFVSDLHAHVSALHTDVPDGKRPKQLLSELQSLHALVEEQRALAAIRDFAPLEGVVNTDGSARLRDPDAGVIRSLLAHAFFRSVVREKVVPPPPTPAELAAASARTAIAALTEEQVRTMPSDEIYSLASALGVDIDEDMRGIIGSRGMVFELLRAAAGGYGAVSGGEEEEEEDEPERIVFVITAETDELLDRVGSLTEAQVAALPRDDLVAMGEAAGADVWHGAAFTNPDASPAEKLLALRTALEETEANATLVSEKQLAAIGAAEKLTREEFDAMSIGDIRALSDRIVQGNIAGGSTRSAMYKRLQAVIDAMYDDNVVRIPDVQMRAMSYIAYMTVDDISWMSDDQVYALAESIGVERDKDMELHIGVMGSRKEALARMHSEIDSIYRLGGGFIVGTEGPEHAMRGDFGRDVDEVIAEASAQGYGRKTEAAEAPAPGATIVLDRPARDVIALRDADDADREAAIARAVEEWRARKAARKAKRESELAASRASAVAAEGLAALRRAEHAAAAAAGTTVAPERVIAPRERDARGRARASLFSTGPLPAAAPPGESTQTPMLLDAPIGYSITAPTGLLERAICYALIDGAGAVHQLVSMRAFHSRDNEPDSLMALMRSAQAAMPDAVLDRRTLMAGAIWPDFPLRMADTNEAVRAYQQLLEPISPSDASYLSEDQEFALQPGKALRYAVAAIYKGSPAWLLTLMGVSRRTIAHAQQLYADRVSQPRTHYHFMLATGDQPTSEVCALSAKAAREWMQLALTTRNVFFVGKMWHMIEDSFSAAHTDRDAPELSPPYGAVRRAIFFGNQNDHVHGELESFNAVNTKGSEPWRRARWSEAPLHRVLHFFYTTLIALAAEPALDLDQRLAEFDAIMRDQVFRYVPTSEPPRRYPKRGLLEPRLSRMAVPMNK